ncbi:MAG: hypothetical protein OXE99_11560 [Cellvibrionales bacterium]|nr:hypothetical protein [Cellvibrionales bacterium]
MQERVTLNLSLPDALAPITCMIAGVVCVFLWVLDLPISVFFALSSLAIVSCCYNLRGYRKQYQGQLVFYQGQWRYYDANNKEIALKRAPRLVEANNLFVVLEVEFVHRRFSSMFYLSCKHLGEDKSRWVKRYFMF